MKKIIRFVVIVLIICIFWPFFLVKLYGNAKPKVLNKTIIIANHNSNFDPFLIKLLFLRRKIYFVASINVKKKISTRLFTWLFDCLYVQEDSYVNIEFVKKSIKILNSGGVICIFPEGVIIPKTTGFFEFKKAYLYLAKKTDANILPLYIYPDLSLFKKSKIYIGETLYSKIFTEYKDDEEINTYIMSLLTMYRLEVDKTITV